MLTWYLCSTMSTGLTNVPTALLKLQRKLGYTFADAALLSLALTHKSYARDNNERLEFVGDAVLGYVVGDMLYNHYQEIQEDRLSLMRSRLVRGRTLAAIAGQVGIDEGLLLGEGERKSGGRQRDSLQADAFEAVIGAIHEDSGIDACRQVIEQLFHEPMLALEHEELRDAKTRLQEHVQALGIGLPVYEVAEVGGVQHARMYTVTCRIEGLSQSAQGSASSRREAEKVAAANVLSQLQSMSEDKPDE